MAAVRVGYLGPEGEEGRAGEVEDGDDPVQLRELVCWRLLVGLGGFSLGCLRAGL